MDNISKEISRIEEDAEISAKRHFNQAKTYEIKHCWLGLPLAILAAIASVSALSEMPYGAIIAGIISLIVAVLTAVNAFLAPGEKALNHNQSGAGYLALRNRSRIFRTVEISQQSSEQQTKTLLELNSMRDELNKNSPQTSREAFDAANSGIEAGESLYAVDKLNGASGD